MIKVDLVQGSPEWLAFRKGKLSSSKLPVILGISPYQTPLELWEEELGLREPKPSSRHMEDGLKAEDAARNYFYQNTGITVEPAVFQKKDNPLFIASLDGYNEEKGVVLEIKNNNMDFHEMAISGKIPEFHFCQCQNHMYVTGLSHCHYLSWRPSNPKVVIIPRDEVFINRMVEVGLEFRKILDNLIQPELTDRDYVDMEDDFQMTEWAHLYKSYQAVIKEYQDKADFVKEKMKERASYGNAKGFGFKLTHFKQNRIDYDAVIEKHCPNVDLNQYRTKTCVSYRLTVE